MNTQLTQSIFHTESKDKIQNKAFLCAPEYFISEYQWAIHTNICYWFCFVFSIHCGQKHYQIYGLHFQTHAIRIYIYIYMDGMQSCKVVTLKWRQFNRLELSLLFLLGCVHVWWKGTLVHFIKVAIAFSENALSNKRTLLPTPPQNVM